MFIIIDHIVESKVPTKYWSIDGLPFLDPNKNYFSRESELNHNNKKDFQLEIDFNCDKEIKKNITNDVVKEQDIIIKAQKEEIRKLNEINEKKDKLFEKLMIDNNNLKHIIKHKDKIIEDYEKALKQIYNK